MNINYTGGFHTYYVYILTNKNKTVLYTGVTNNLKIRLEQHKSNKVLKPSSFTGKYNTFYLIYFQKFTWVQEAIAQEKVIKGWTRQKKLDLIYSINPELKFLNYLFEASPNENDGA